MQPCVSCVVGDQAKDHTVADHESHHCHQCIHDTEDLEEGSRRTWPSHSTEKKNHAGSDVDEVVRRIDMKNAEQHRHTIYVSSDTRHETENYDCEKNETKKNSR